MARPPSKAYQFKKFVRRNRAPVLTSAIVAMALVTVAALALWQAMRATHAEGAALTAADQATRSEQAARLAAAAEKKAKEDAVARESETKAVLEFVENRVFAAAPAGTRVRGPSAKSNAPQSDRVRPALREAQFSQPTSHRGPNFT